MSRFLLILLCLFLISCDKKCHVEVIVRDMIHNCREHHNNYRLVNSDMRVIRTGDSTLIYTYLGVRCCYFMSTRDFKSDVMMKTVKRTKLITLALEKYRDNKIEMKPQRISIIDNKPRHVSINNNITITNDCHD